MSSPRIDKLHHTGLASAGPFFGYQPLCVCQRAHDPQHTPARTFCQIVFPNPHDEPILFAERATDPQITRPIRFEFLFPEFAVAGRGIAMLGTAMPETSVHEDCDLHILKHKVRFAEYGLLTSPAGHALLAQQLHQGEFSVLVASPPNPGHDFGALRLGENVRHDSRLQHCSRLTRPS